MECRSSLALLGRQIFYQGNEVNPHSHPVIVSVGLLLRYDYRPWVCGERARGRRVQKEGAPQCRLSTRLENSRSKKIDPANLFVRDGNEALQPHHASADSPSCNALIKAVGQVKR